MRFWDTSALVALFLVQGPTARLRELLAEDIEVAAWVLADVEFRSAIERMRRENRLAGDESKSCLEAFDGLWRSARVVSLLDTVKLRAKRALGIHSLRAQDALQLGAALVAADDDPDRFEFVTLDRRLAEGAHREGFTVLP